MMTCLSVFHKRDNRIAGDLLFPFSCHLCQINLNPTGHQFNNKNVHIKKLKSNKNCLKCLKIKIVAAASIQENTISLNVFGW